MSHRDSIGILLGAAQGASPAHANVISQDLHIAPFPPFRTPLPMSKRNRQALRPFCLAGRRKRCYSRRSERRFRTFCTVRARTPTPEPVLSALWADGWMDVIVSGWMAGMAEMAPTESKIMSIGEWAVFWRELARTASPADANGDYWRRICDISPLSVHFAPDHHTRAGTFCTSRHGGRMVSFSGLC